LLSTAGVPFNATHATYATHARKYVTNAVNASDVRIAKLQPIGTELNSTFLRFKN